MKTELTKDAAYGRLLWMTNGRTEAAASLDYGLRIMVLRLAGRENLLYRQPEDLSDGFSTEQGWRLFGGHRFWAAPESRLSYYPDGEPVEYRIGDDCAELLQRTDPWTGFQKTLRLSFDEDGSLNVEHLLTNRGDAAVCAAPWGITTLRGGGRAELSFAGPGGGYAPNRVLALWGKASPADGRLSFTADSLLARHDPEREKLKLGVYSPQGRIAAENLGQRLEISFPVHPLEACPDGGCNAELYMNRHIMELETLGERKMLAPGESAVHRERWRLSPAD